MSVVAGFRMSEMMYWYLLARLRDVHVVVEAQQGGRPGLFLQRIHDPGRAPGDVMLGLVAGGADAVARSRGRPGLRGVRPDVVEAVLELLGAVIGRVNSRLNVEHPLVGGPDVAQNFLVEPGEFIDEEAREGAAGKQ